MDRQVKHSLDAKKGVLTQKDYRKVAYLLPVLVILIVSMTGCGPAVVSVPAGNIDKASSSPSEGNVLYLNSPGGMDFTYTSNWSSDSGYREKSQLELVVRPGSDDDSQEALNIDVTQQEQTKPDKKAGVHPFKLSVTPKKEGQYEVIVEGRECVGADQCGDWTEYNISVVYDTTAPTIVNLDDPTSATDSSITGAVSDNLSGVSSIAAVGCNGNNQSAAQLDGQGGFQVKFTPVPGDNCVLLQVGDKTGNITQTEVHRKYSLDVGLTVDAFQVDNKLFVFGNLPSTAKAESLSISGEQPRWKFFGIKGKFTCSDSGNPGSFDYVFQCQMPDKHGGPLKIHLTFTDEFGNVFNVSYPDVANFDVNLDKAPFWEQVKWFGTMAGGLIATLAAGGGLLELRRRFIKSKQVKEKRTKNRLALETEIAIKCGKRQYGQALTLLADLKTADFPAEYKEEIKEKIRRYEYTRAKTDMQADLSPGSDAILKSPDLEDKLSRGIDGLNLMLKSPFTQREEEKPEINELFWQFIPLLDQWLSKRFFSSSVKSLRAVRQNGNWEKIEPVLRLILEMQTSQKYSSLWRKLKREPVLSDAAKRLNDIAIIYAGDTNLLLRPQVLKRLVYEQWDVKNMLAILWDWGLYDAFNRILSAIKDSKRSHIANKFAVSLANIN